MPPVQVLLVDPEFGHVLKSDGSLFLPQDAEEDAIHTCQSEAEAIELRDSLLRRVPWGSVVVRDMSTSREVVYRDEHAAARYDAARMALTRGLPLPFFVRWFVARPPHPRSIF